MIDADCIKIDVKRQSVDSFMWNTSLCMILTNKSVA